MEQKKQFNAAYQEFTAAIKGKSKSSGKWNIYMSRFIAFTTNDMIAESPPTVGFTMLNSSFIMYDYNLPLSASNMVMLDQGDIGSRNSYVPSTTGTGIGIGIKNVQFIIESSWPTAQPTLQVTLPPAPAPPSCPRGSCSGARKFAQTSIKSHFR